MQKLLSASVAIGITGYLTGCQMTHNQVTSLPFNDPASVHDYQLPVFPDGIKLLTNYKQTRNQQTWFWSELENHTYQQGENLIVQVVSSKPLKQPPKLFAFSLPQVQGKRRYNAIGAYQRWVITAPNGESCVYAQQYTRKESNWLSIFVHYCTLATKPKNVAWLDNLKPSFYLEGL